MNVTQLNVIATTSTTNIHAGEVVAFRRAGQDAWLDPWGGVFDDGEQHELDRFAKGDIREITLNGVDGERTFAAILVAKF